MPLVWTGIASELTKYHQMGKVFWRCLGPSCTVRMETVGIHDEPTPRGQQDHTHAPNRDEFVRRKAEHDMREKAKSGTASIPAIYDEVAKTVNREQPNVAATLPAPSPPALKSSLYRARRSLRFPKLPQTVADLQEIPQVFANTGQKHDIHFLLNNSLADGNEGSIVMATDFCISLLGEKKKQLVYGLHV